jgi:hypothetical protein
MKIQFIFTLFIFGLEGCAHLPSTPWPEQILRGANVSTEATEADLEYFKKDWNGNVVRVLHLTPLADRAPYEVREEALASMYRTTERALAQHLAVVFAPAVAMENNDQFFSNRAQQLAYLEFWKRVTRHFKGVPGAISFDLMNEPHDELAKTHWNQYAKELTTEIRKLDPARTLIVEAPEWAWPDGFAFLEPTGDANTIYSFHSYAPNEFTVQKTKKGFLTATEGEWKKRIYPGSTFEGEFWNHQTMLRKLQPVFDFEKKNHVKIWCGEFGVARWARGSVQWLHDMIQIFEEHQIGWAYYSYREWQVMDLEMDPSVKNEKTSRSLTPLVQEFKGALQLNRK